MSFLRNFQEPSEPEPEPEADNPPAPESPEASNWSDSTLHDKEGEDQEEG